MFNIIFGLFFILITVPFWVAIIASGEYSVLFFISIFDIVGLIFFVIGLKKAIKDGKTRRNGVETYAQINAVLPSGTYVNGVPELKGEFTVFNPNTYQTENVSEILGVGAFEYQVGQVVKVKYYDGDINIIEIVDISQVPGDASKFFTTPVASTPSVGGSIPTSSLDGITNPADIIEIDGVKYKKM